MIISLLFFWNSIITTGNIDIPKTCFIPDEEYYKYINEDKNNENGISDSANHYACSASYRI